jgi:hypothetical protein
MDCRLKQYRISLNRWPEPEDISEMSLYGFLGTWLGQDVAAAALFEADEKGTATRTITYPLVRFQRFHRYSFSVTY